MLPVDFSLQLQSLPACPSAQHCSNHGTTQRHDGGDYRNRHFDTHEPSLAPEGQSTVGVTKGSKPLAGRAIPTASTLAQAHDSMHDRTQGPHTRHPLNRFGLDGVHST